MAVKHDTISRIISGKILLNNTQKQNRNTITRIVFFLGKKATNHVKFENHLAEFVVFVWVIFVCLRVKGVFTVRKLITLVCVNVMEYKFVHITNYTLWLIIHLLIQLFNIAFLLVGQIILTKITSPKRAQLSTA